ncbi:ABC transporter permease [Nakamurella antarctica]|uniref:ABC transporter permease n=1 Tax=Nakamurella antarctica TaxID=1902245 RepID=A0A3G8ZHG9_9ACTN|nr:ABC transporter permease [Nakamurella antarctica]AZI56832.1 ABC transporter permease [Nakamurella antarctica]
MTTFIPSDITTTAPPKSDSAGGNGSRNALRAVLPPILLGVLVIVGWQLLVDIKDIKPYLLPSPSGIVAETGKMFPQLIKATTATGWNALVGFVVGAIIAIGAAIVASQVVVINKMLVPIVSALAVVPIVALAPVLFSMLGATSETPRRVIVSITIFAPIFINTLRGLRQVLPVHRDLMHAYAASRRQLTKNVTIPGALPFVFTGLRIASSLAVIAAVVAEYFGGLQNGLGGRIASAAGGGNNPRAWSYVLGAIVLGLIFYGVTLLLERIAQRKLAPKKEA